jgi:hypothetical protein
MRLGFSGNPGTHIYGSLGKYPKYMSNPETKLKRKKKVEDSKARFKRGYPGSNQQHVPTPSISQNKRNLRNMIIRRIKTSRR